MKGTSLIIGASGFIGRNLAFALRAEGYGFRCLARNPGRAAPLAKAGFEVVPGDMLDAGSIDRAIAGTQSVYLSVQTVTRRQPGLREGDFMEAEYRGLDNVLAACRSHGVRRVIYVTPLGIEPGSSNPWMHGRWVAEQRLLESGLDATILQPGQELGLGGGAFDMT